MSGGRAALFFRRKDGTDARVWANRSSTQQGLEEAVAQCRSEGTPFGFIWFDAVGIGHVEPLTEQRGILSRLEELCKQYSGKSRRGTA